MNFPKRIWINGRLENPEKPVLSVFDRGFLYGDGVYETIRVYNGKPFCFDEHFRRLLNSVRGVRLRLSYSRRAVLAATHLLLKANGLTEAAVRITLTRGPGPLGFDPRPCRKPTLVLIAAPPHHHAPALYRNGIRLALADVRRNARVSLDPSLKTINNLNNIFAKMEAIRGRAYEALMLNAQGYLAEGTISNVFFVRRNVLFTPSLDCGILAGVTRDLVLRLARRRGLRVKEGRFRPADLYRADEAFITSTTMEVMPVSVVVDSSRRAHRIAAGRPGPWTNRLWRDYRDVVTGRTGAKFEATV